MEKRYTLMPCIPCICRTVCEIATGFSNYSCPQWPMDVNEVKSFSEKCFLCSTEISKLLIYKNKESFI